MSVAPGEPLAGPWRAAPISELVELIFAAAGTPWGRPRIVAVDGRGAGGKSTLADRLHREVPDSAVVHTDDLAWHESFFGWGQLLGEGVLEPLHRGEPVSFAPPAWRTHGRKGTVDVPAGLDLVLVEGVGASQRELASLIDATVWVQSDAAEAERRGIERDVAQGVNGDAAQTIAFWHEWMAQELPFLAAQRPWERACVVVAGTPPCPLMPDQVALAPAPRR